MLSLATVERVCFEFRVVMPRCYVCYEDTAEQCVCACKAHVHRACLLKTIEARNSTQCSICAQPIQNVRALPVRRVSRWVVCFAVVLMATIVSTSLAAILLLALAVDDRNHSAFYDLLICCASCVCVSTCASSFLQKLMQDHELVVAHEMYCFI